MTEFFANNSFLINLIGINAILALSIYMTLSCAMLSLSNAASMAIGAYASGVLTLKAGWPFWPAAIAGAVVAALVAFLLGLPILRLRGVFLAIATIGFGEVVRVAIVNTEALGSSEGFRLNTRQVNIEIGFWHIFGTLAVLAFFFSRLKGSRMGLALEAIREDESAARTMGINVTFYKVSAYVLGAFIAGLAGALYGHLRAYFSPGDFGFQRAVDILVFAVVGGTFAWRGAIAGAFLMTVLSEVLRAIPPVGGVAVKDYPEIFTGLILLGVILFLPNGLLSAALKLNIGRKTPHPIPEQIEPDPRMSELGDSSSTADIANEALRGPGPAAAHDGTGENGRDYGEEGVTRTGAGPKGTSK
jgi:branched-chain amino acid transport system permease protein